MPFNIRKRQDRLMSMVDCCPRETHKSCRSRFSWDWRYCPFYLRSEETYGQVDLDKETRFRSFSSRQLSYQSLEMLHLVFTVEFRFTSEWSRVKAAKRHSFSLKLCVKRHDWSARSLHLHESFCLIVARTPEIDIVSSRTLASKRFNFKRSHRL